MAYVSTSPRRDMSDSRKHKTFVAALLAALLMAGCGGSSTGEKSTGDAAPEDLSGALEATQRTGTPQVQSENATPAGDDGAAPESTDFAPVDVDLKGGSFASNTPTTIHVPSDFILIVTARARDSRTYSLSVISPSVAQTFKIGPRGEKKITLDSLREGQKAKLIVGKKTVKIAADAEPGP